MWVRGKKKWSHSSHAQKLMHTWHKKCFLTSICHVSVARRGPPLDVGIWGPAPQLVGLGWKHDPTHDPARLTELSLGPYGRSMGKTERNDQRELDKQTKSEADSNWTMKSKKDH